MLLEVSNRAVPDFRVIMSKINLNVLWILVVQFKGEH